MKEFLNKYRKIVIGIIIFWAFLVLLFVTMLAVSLVQADQFEERLLKSGNNENLLPGWNEYENTGTL